ncbi:hypothetical protein QE152_g29396 [Popillia japonica]|uniref:Uncharacterized protein n=1 Tax=Popillia japonica TaxID=7064 RepID=A0AAW1JHW0_POPJA
MAPLNSVWHNSGDDQTAATTTQEPEEEAHDHEEEDEEEEGLDERIQESDFKFEDFRKKDWMKGSKKATSNSKTLLKD